MLDIQEGDVLVVGAKEYAIKSASEWDGFGSTSSFARIATVSASTKRTTVSSGKRTAPATYLNNLKITPLDPISASAVGMLSLKTNELTTPEELKQCFVADGTGYLQLIVEDVKR